MRNAVIAAVAVAVLAAVSLAVIGTAKGPSRPPPPDPAPAAPAPAADPAPAPQASAPAPLPPAGETAPAVSAAPAPEAPPAAPSADEQAAPGDARAWETIPPLPNGWPALMVKIAQLEPDSDACRPQLARARVRRPNARGAQAGAEPGAPTVLLLELETREGEVHVVDAPVEARGAASDAVVSCVQATLAGKAIPLPGTRPGQRMRLRFPVR